MNVNHQNIYSKASVLGWIIMTLFSHLYPYSLPILVHTTGYGGGHYTATVTAMAEGYAHTSFTTELTVEVNNENIIFPLQINFQNAGATPPNGYEKDFGEAYGQKTSGLHYGWVSADGNKTPLSLAGNGRNRNKSGYSVLENTFMHMQYDDDGGSNGVSEEGIWEIEIPNGTYQVMITAGDVNKESFAGARHVVNAEGVNIIDYAAVLQSPNIESNGRLITVSDGKLTLDASGGANTKVMAVVMTTCSDHPAVVHISIPNGAVGVDVNASISANSICFPHDASIDESTLNHNTAFLREVSIGAKIPGDPETTGGGDGITITPDELLNPFTKYEFVVTTGLKDGVGVAFQSFSSTFTTGDHVNPPSPIVFSKLELVSGTKYTSLVIGPDEKLYGLSIDGHIYRWNINTDGTLSGKQEINALRNAEGGDRLAIGMCFDPAATSGNLILWVSHTTFGVQDMPDWGGKISRLSGPDLATVQDYVINLPRSSKDHATNGIAFKPGEDGALYFLQGSNSGMGLPDGSWGNRPERLLNAALLKLDIALAVSAGLPIDVKTEDGGTYDPFSSGAPLTIYASGIRNAYDMVWHSNGLLYVPTNGSNGGKAKTPEAAGSFDYIQPSVQNDYLYTVVEGGYYGHPNPLRDEWILNGGNPTIGYDGENEVPEYEVGTLPDPNYRGYAYNFGANLSPNGVIEYKSDVFNGVLQGKLLVVRFAAGNDIFVLTPGNPMVGESGLQLFPRFTNPLDLVEHIPTGNIYLSAFGSKSGDNVPGKIFLLKPDDGNVIPPSTTTMALENMTKIPGTNTGFPADDFYTFHKNVKGSNSARQWHHTNVMRIHNTGSQPLSIHNLLISDETRFKIVDMEGVPFTGNEFPVIISPNQHKDITLEFIEDSGNKGPREEKLTIFSNAENHPEWEVTLKGTFMLKTEGGNEVNAQQVMQAFGFTTSMNGQVKPSSDYPSEADVNQGVHGDLILSKYFVQADPAQPVRAFKLAALKGPGTAPTKLININNTNTVAGFFYNWGTDWHQSMFPREGNASDIVAGKSVNDISVPFRISIANYKTSGGNAQDEGVDQMLGVRVYKAFDKNGDIIPYHYLVIQDYIQDGCGSGSANCDWNDNVEYFINIKPADDPFIVGAIDDLTVVADIPFSYDVSVFFDRGYPGNNLTFTANTGGSSLPNWLTLDPNTGVFNGTPPASTASSTLSIAVTATDVNGINVFDAENTTFEMAISSLNNTAREAQTLTDNKISEAIFLGKGKENSLLAYPNPVSKTLHIKFSVPLEGQTKVQLFDPMGRTLMDRTFNIAENEEMISLDLSEINIGPGMLYLKIIPETTSGSILRLIKQ